MNYGYYGHRMTDEELLELRRRAAANLKDIRAGKFRREASEKREEKKTELQKALAWEIQLGHDVLERRELSKPLNRLLRKSELTAEEMGMAEELQSMVDKYDQALDGYTRDELKRFVRLWNKSQKVKYKTLSYEDFQAKRNKP